MLGLQCVLGAVVVRGHDATRIDDERLALVQLIASA